KLRIRRAEIAEGRFPGLLKSHPPTLPVAGGYLQPLLMLLLDTGLRPNAEALPLRWKDVDFKRGMATVVSSKTPAGLRTVPMTTRLKEELLRWKETDWREEF